MGGARRPSGPLSFLIVVHPYPPTPSSGAYRWGAMVKYLRRAGHDVRVVTSGAFGKLPPGEEGGVTRTPDLMASPTLRRLAGLGPLATPGAGPPAADPNPPKVLTHVLVPDSFLASWAPAALRDAWRALNERPADCVITSSPNDSTHLVGLALKRRFGHAWIADLRDGWTFERFMPEFPLAAQRGLNRALERRVLRAADGVTCATRPIAEDLRSRYRIPALHVPNAWDPDLDPPSGEATPREPGATRTLVHTGKLTGAWGRDPTGLFVALGRVAAEDGNRLRLVVAGKLDQDDAAAIERADLGDALEHVGQLPRSESLELQRRADALVLVTSPHVGEATGKLYEYLAAGRPILALAAGNEAARIVTETGTGIAVDPGDVDGIASALRAVAEGSLPYSPRGLEAYRYPAPAGDVAELAQRLSAAEGHGPQA